MQHYAAICITWIALALFLHLISTSNAQSDPNSSQVEDSQNLTLEQNASLVLNSSIVNGNVSGTQGDSTSNNGNVTLPVEGLRVEPLQILEVTSKYRREENQFDDKS